MFSSGPLTLLIAGRACPMPDRPSDLVRVVWRGRSCVAVRTARLAPVAAPSQPRPSSGTTVGGYDAPVAGTTNAAGTGSHGAAGWVLRSLAAMVLFVAALRWSSEPVWSGNAHCPMTEGMCEQSWMEAHAPASLWVVTAVGSLVACVVAAASGPKDFRQRLVWAVAIATCVFVAHRHNRVWAAAVSALGVYGVASTTDDVRGRGSSRTDEHGRRVTGGYQ